MSLRGKIIIKEDDDHPKPKINKFLYVADHAFIKKYCANPKTHYDYLPIINSLKLDLDELANSQFLIYLKCVKATKSTISGFYGYFTGEHILIKNKQKSQIKNKELDKNIICVDDAEYKLMVRNYNLCDMDNLIFVKYSTLNPFKSITSVKTYKTICEKHDIQIEKLPPRSNCLNIAPDNTDPTIKYIEFELEKEIEDDEEDDEEEEDEEGEDEDEEVGNKEEDMGDKIGMGIPIVWNPCKVIIGKMDDLTIKKLDISTHYKNCELCDITDNNRIKLVFDKRKVNLQTKHFENKEHMDSIINSYQLDKKYIEKKTIFDEMSFSEDKINIVYYDCEGEFYDKSFFIICK